VSNKPRVNKKTELGQDARKSRGAKDPPQASPARRRTLEVEGGQVREVAPVVPVKRVYPQRPVRAVAGKGARKRGLRQ
jgi:hypothetical protein